MHWCIKSTCADVPPRVRRPAARSVSDEFTQSYTLARSPKGFFDVLYVDETMLSMTALRTVGLPTTILIDAQGRELGRLVGPAEWDDPEMVSFLRGFTE